MANGLLVPCLIVAAYILLMVLCSLLITDNAFCSAVSVSLTLNDLFDTCKCNMHNSNEEALSYIGVVRDSKLNCMTCKILFRCSQCGPHQCLVILICIHICYVKNRVYLFVP